jgi:isopenicillin-N epimerase
MSLAELPEPDSGRMRDLFMLRPDVVYLNHGAYGACPRPVFETYQQWQRELERQPVEFLGRRARERLAAARAALGEYVGAAADDVVYVSNATTAMNIVARSLPLRPGDEVVGTDHEYGAMERTWRFVCERRGARYVPAPVAVPVTSPDRIIDDIWARVTDRTRVVFLSHITSSTALIFPVEAVCRRAREAGIVTVVDGAHAAGQIDIDLERLGVDFYAANCHKWMCAPKGAGFLYARREVQPLLAPLVVSWGWQSAQPGPSRFIDEQEWQGTRDLAAFLSVPDAIAFLRAHLTEEVRAACHALARRARDAITAMTGLPALSPDGPAWFAQMVSVPVPCSDPQDVRRRLFEELRIEVLVVSWNGRALLRLSAQAYNTQGDIAALVDATRALLREPR